MEQLNNEVKTALELSVELTSKIMNWAMISGHSNSDDFMLAHASAKAALRAYLTGIEKKQDLRIVSSNVSISDLAKFDEEYFKNV